MLKLFFPFRFFLFPQSRLIDLDTADDFVEKAKELYPRLDPDGMSDLEWDHHPADLKHSPEVDQNQNTSGQNKTQNQTQEEQVNDNHQVHYVKEDQLEIVFESKSGEIERE